jgi:hypothetical protein
MDRYRIYGKHVHKGFYAVINISRQNDRIDCLNMKWSYVLPCTYKEHDKVGYPVGSFVPAKKRGNNFN